MLIQLYENIYIWHRSRYTLIQIIKGLHRKNLKFVLNVSSESDPDFAKLAHRAGIIYDEAPLPNNHWVPKHDSQQAVRRVVDDVVRRIVKHVTRGKALLIYSWDDNPSLIVILAIMKLIGCDLIAAIGWTREVTPSELETLRKHRWFKWYLKEFEKRK